VRYKARLKMSNMLSRDESVDRFRTEELCSIIATTRPLNGENRAAKREYLNHKKYSTAEGGSESALLRSGSVVAGVADARILSRLPSHGRRQSAHPHHPGQARL
jgi:hypothetical protein